MPVTATVESKSARRAEALVGSAVILVAAALATGAVRIPGEAGYGGVGPNFLPWLVSAALAVCGAVLLWEALSGGFRERAPAAEGSEKSNWQAFAWVSAGLLANAALITTVGFIISCALCYVLAAQGLRRAAGQGRGSARTWFNDIAWGAAISAPVFWMFTLLLGINLPGLTGTGWL